MNQTNHTTTTTDRLMELQFLYHKNIENYNNIVNQLLYRTNNTPNDNNIPNTSNNKWADYHYIMKYYSETIQMIINNTPTPPQTIIHPPPIPVFLPSSLSTAQLPNRFFPMNTPMVNINTNQTPTTTTTTTFPYINNTTTTTGYNIQQQQPQQQQQQLNNPFLFQQQQLNNPFLFQQQQPQQQPQYQYLFNQLNQPQPQLQQQPQQQQYRTTTQSTLPLFPPFFGRQRHLHHLQQHPHIRNNNQNNINTQNNNNINQNNTNTQYEDDGEENDVSPSMIDTLILYLLEPSASSPLLRQPFSLRNILDPSAIALFNDNTPETPQIPTAEQIQNATEILIFDENDETNEHDINDVCSICMEAYRDGDVLYEINHCRHKFHKHELEHWFAQHNYCPCCRYSILTPPPQNDNTTAR